MRSLGHVDELQAQACEGMPATVAGKCLQGILHVRPGQPTLAGFRIPNAHSGSLFGGIRLMELDLEIGTQFLICVSGCGMKVQSW